MRTERLACNAIRTIRLILHIPRDGLVKFPIIPSPPSTPPDLLQRIPNELGDELNSVGFKRPTETDVGDEEEEEFEVEFVWEGDELEESKDWTLGCEEGEEGESGQSDEGSDEPTW